MKIKHYVHLIFFGFLIISLSVLQPTLSQQTTTYGEDFPHTENGDSFPMVSPISIDSPTNTTYTTNKIMLNFTVKTFFNNSQGSAIMTYSLDGKDNVTLPSSIAFIPVEATVTHANGKQTTETSQFFSYYAISSSVDLKDLQPGQHSLTVFGRYRVYSMSDKVGLDSQTIYFTVDDKNLPAISNVSVDEGAIKPESSVNKFYVVIVVFSLVAVITCTLVIKHRQTTKSDI